MNNSYDFEIENGVLTKYKGNAGNVVIPDGLTSIGDYAFYNCSGLKSITISDSVKNIGSFAFKGCTGLTSITIPDSVTSIGWMAFIGCSGLKSIAIPDSVTSIGYSAFEGCTGLTSITIPNGVTHIGIYAFKGCTGLKSIAIPEGVDYILDGTFSETGIESLVLPKSLKGVSVRYSGGSGAFSYCKHLKEVIIESEGTELDLRCFQGCTNIRRCQVPHFFGLNSTSWWKERFPETVFPVIALESLGSEDLLTKYILKDYQNTCITLSKVQREDLITRLFEIKTLQSRKKVTIDALDEMLAFTTKSNFVEASAMIINYKKKNYSTQDLEENDNIKMEKAFGLRKLTVNDYKKMFKFKSERSGIVICDYLGNDDVVEIPSVIGKTPVYKIAGKSFQKKNITDVIIPSSVTEIESNAFCDCKRLINVEINAEIKELGCIFFACPNIERISLPKSLESLKSGADFANLPKLSKLQVDNINAKLCVEDGIVYSRDGKTLVLYPTYKKEKSFTVPDSVTTIAENAFENNGSLRNIIISERVTSVGNAAFMNCDNLSIVTLNGKLKKVSKWMFCGCKHLQKIDLPLSVTSIEEGAFRNSGIATLPVHDKIKKIGNYAFYGCTSLTEAVLPNNIAAVGKFAFASCSELETVLLPTVIDKIEEGVFSKCRKLKNITIHQGITKIGKSAFSSCDIDSITIPDSVKEIESDAFSFTNIQSLTVPASVISLSGFRSCRHLENVQILGTPAIVSSAFYGCHNLKEIVIPEGTPEIRGESFCMSGLKSIDIPGSVKNLGKAVFSECENLETVDIHEGVTDVSQYAFSGCKNLKSLSLPESTSIHWSAFSESNKEMIVFGTVEDGKAAKFAESQGYKFVKKENDTDVK